MRLRIGRPRAALVIAPHPDDEVIGAFGLIQRLRSLGTRVWVVIVTDGAASHRGSARWPAARLARARRGESRRALARLGIAAERLRFLSLPDGGLGAAEPDCRRALDRTIRAVRSLDLLIGPAADDAHPDHRVVARCLARSRFGGRRLSYAVWPHQRRRGARDQRVVTDRVAKRSVIGCFRTQLGAITDDPAGFAIARHELAAFSHAVERYRDVR